MKSLKLFSINLMVILLFGIKTFISITFICFLTSIHINGQDKTNNENIIHIEKSNYGLIFTDIQINGGNVKAMIDFGDPNVLQISSQFVINEGIQVEKTNAVAKDMFGNTFDINKGIANEVVIGNWVDVNVEFSSSPNEMESVAKQINTKFEAVVGWGYFSKYYTEIDYKSNIFKLYWEKPENKKVLFSSLYNKNSNYLSVPVMINSKEENLIIDTGSPVTVFHSEFYNENGRENLSFDIGNKSFSLEPQAQDLSILKQLNAVGIIGGDFLVEYKVLIDPFGKELIFM